MTTVVDGAVDRVRELLAQVPATKADPAWHARLRLEACEWAMDHGLPTTKDEDWRYTRLEPIFELPLAPAAARRDPRPVARRSRRLSVRRPMGPVWSSSTVTSIPSDPS